jgi:cation transport ATPase
MVEDAQGSKAPIQRIADRVSGIFVPIVVGIAILSFIGWYLLGALFFGIGGFFVNPYVDATNAELYDIFKRDLIEKNILSNSELSLN